MTEFFTWGYLATYAGAIAATGFITHLIKDIMDRVFYMPTRILAYFVALAVLMVSHHFVGDLNGSTAALCVFNAIVVASASSGCVDTMKQISK